MELRIGDRYDWYNKGHSAFADAIEYVGNNEWLITEGPKAGEMYPVEIITSSKSWVYIGNFSKSRNFNNLYDILCS